MRFSLATLLIFAIWLSALVGVWVRREAWYFEGDWKEQDQRAFYDRLQHNQATWNAYSPDGTRALLGLPTGFKICDKRTSEVLYTAGNESSLIGFIDNDAVLCVSDRHLLWRRRHPERWWGHLYRPELWLAVSFGLLWLWRVVRWLRKRPRSSTKPSAAPQTP